MRIISCHIDNFGKLHNYDVCFSDLTEVIEKNGWGKSTLAQFIKAMFYGLSGNARKSITDNEFVHYTPWSNESFTGRLVFETNGRTYIIIRDFSYGKKGFFELRDAITNKISTDYSEKIGEELFGMDRESFERTVFINESSKVLLGATNDINAHIGNLSSAIDDINNYDVAEENLNDYLNKMSPTRKTGRIRIMKDELLLKKEKIKTKETLERRIHECDQEIASLRANVEKISQKKKIVLEKYKKATETKIKQLEEKNLAAKNASSIKAENEAEDGLVIRRLLLFICCCMAGVICIITGCMCLVVIPYGGKDLNPVRIIGIVSLIIGFLMFTAGLLNKRLIRKKNDIKTKTGKDGVIIDASTGEDSGINEDFNSAGEDSAINAVFKGTGEDGARNAAFNSAGEDGARNAAFKSTGEENAIDHILSDLDKRYEITIRNIEAISKEKEKLIEEYEAILELSDKAKDLEMEIEKALDKYQKIEKTRDYLRKAKDNFLSKYLNPVKKNFDHYYKVLSSNEFSSNELSSSAKYSDSISMDTDVTLLVMDEGRQREISYMSDGIKSLMGLALRFALCDAIFKNEKPFILLDDPFTDLDDDNLLRAKRLVKDMAKDYQVIYLSCSKVRGLS